MKGDGVDDEMLELVSAWVRVLSLRTRLLRWYDQEKRELPWRTTRDPYHVLVSELMLQQTRVDVVLPYFARWIERWPTITALAEAQEEEVLAAWSGLGYYRRARSLLAVAREVVASNTHDGVIPADPAVLEQLPGIGPYTAAAIASIAFDVPVAVVDGNVERVLCRLLADERDPSAARRRTVEEAARRLVTGMTDDDREAPPPPDLRPADWNQAMMELGALVCVPREPKCPLCPWHRSCLGHRGGLVDEVPRRKAKKPARDVALRMAVVHRGEHFLLVQRAESTLLSGMWELPTTAEDGTVDDLQTIVASALGTHLELPEAPLRNFRHTITNRRITVDVHERSIPASEVVAEERPGIAWVTLHDLRDFGVSSMTRKALAR